MLLLDPLTAGGPSALLTVIPILGCWPLYLQVILENQRIILVPAPLVESAAAEPTCTLRFWAKLLPAADPFHDSLSWRQLLTCCKPSTARNSDEYVA